MDSKYNLADGARNEMNQTMKSRAESILSVFEDLSIHYEIWPNEALEGRRMLVTISAISALRAGTDRAKHPSPSA